MSIFEAKDYWSTVISNDEEFDANSICIDNIDNESLNKNKIIVSSFKGFLRIYEPVFGEYQNDHLLFEKFYESPILQIDSGNFVVNSGDRQLVILQSKKLLVVKFSNLKGITITKTCFEHRLSRNGYNLCLGKITGKNYHTIFVQSIDGVISIYEQESLVNSILISEIYLPGSISFLSKRDSLLLSNTSYEVECYSYNSLATIKGDSNIYIKIT